MLSVPKKITQHCVQVMIKTMASNTSVACVDCIAIVLFVSNCEMFWAQEVMNTIRDGLIGPGIGVAWEAGIVPK